MNTIKLFMWGCQPHYQFSAELAAEQIFNKLDRNLNPKAFLVGILTEDRAGSYPICLQPEDCGYPPELFQCLKDQAKHLAAIDEESKVRHTHPIAEANHRIRLERKALHEQKAMRKALQKVITDQAVKTGRVSFCSWLVPVEGYMVSVVLQLNREAFDSYYSLKRKQAFERYPLVTSLIDATVAEYLNGCAKELTEPNPGTRRIFWDRDYDEIIRSAGKRLLYTPGFAADISSGGPYNLFDDCNGVSSLRYEDREGVGRMLISKRKHPNIKVDLALCSPIVMSDYRAVRKLLEVSSDELSLLCDSNYIYGLGHEIGVYEEEAEDLFCIKFTGHYSWELRHGNNMLVRVSYGQPCLPRVQIEKEEFIKEAQQIFPDIEIRQIEQLWNLAMKASQQKHGTIVVISAGAESEAARLKTQCINIEQVPLTSQLMERITAIDGAVLMNPNSTCYAIGAILDGFATEKGNPSRGARYNSAIRYVESSKYPCLAIVVSADGGIDLVSKPSS